VIFANIRVEESVLVKNAIQQAKKYQEQLKKLGKQDTTNFN
jgi:hypothetical protein